MTGGVQLLLGDCRAVLKTLPAESVQCCITSPPYFGLRDYGVAGQLGLEKTPDEYVAKMVDVFREVRRVLRHDGTLWLNLGDSFGSGSRSTQAKQTNGHAKTQAIAYPRIAGVQSKQLCGIPWRVAFALQADGWYLRSDIIWAKPNCMPESVTDRPTKSHEYLFLFAKERKYYYDAAAVLEPFADERKGNPGDCSGRYSRCSGRHDAGMLSGKAWNEDSTVAGRNRRSVWTVAPKPFQGCHFAVFPPKLVEPCILAGSAEGSLVLDPFMGSGTTGLVAREHGRRFVGIELNPEYLEMARKRIENVTPKTLLSQEAI